MSGKGPYLRPGIGFAIDAPNITVSGPNPPSGSSGSTAFAVCDILCGSIPMMGAGDGHRLARSGALDTCGPSPLAIHARRSEG